MAHSRPCPAKRVTRADVNSPSGCPGAPAVAYEPPSQRLGLLSGGTTLVSARGMSTGELSWGIAWDVATSPAGEIALGGSFHGDADFGDGPVHAETDAEGEGRDGFIAIYDREAADGVEP